jgi:hypothetical protein
MKPAETETCVDVRLIPSGSRDHGIRRTELVSLVALACGMLACARPEAPTAPEAESIQRAALSGLVAAYGFEEASGNTATDSSGNNLSGTLTGASRVDGRFGKSLEFDGVGDWVTVADANQLDLTTGMTLSAWVYAQDSFPLYSEAPRRS